MEMTPDAGRDLDTRVAQEIFGYEVFSKNEILHENSDQGVHPLRDYSKNMQWAWLVAEKMRVSVIPVENGAWFAFVGPEAGWTAPEAFLEFLKAGDFTLSGASVQTNAAQAICEAALVANQKRNMVTTTASTPILKAVPNVDMEDDKSSDPNSTTIH